ncbi:DUF4350 domain-containing protein [Aquibacillus sp. 3ASR75-11]|uniref:DUF4350 domain-containing protein n=1 Tax=Terrihalobacillus insolitus TaxID=2950438 RepID=A0A9X3WV43_9BACI|nr:DUF4350 domain-containing protein [Terrihalobacillus insolitus]MDC3414177.1 DUF4350 domain-containing protein [Terrihalobacillus insolitus]MDC3425383.1 DUF4350 domain-containing protein [Terrihalobacillus insolitus]
MDAKLQKTVANRRTWLWLTVILLLFIVVSYSLNVQGPKEYPSYVSESPSPTGVKAIYSYLNNQQNFSVTAWSNNPEYLQKDAGNQLMIMVEPSFIPEKNEMEAYMDFMQAGNTILLMMDNPKGMFDVNTVPIEQPLDFEQKIYNESNNTYQATISSIIRLEVSNEDKVLLSDKAGAVAFQRQYGSGSLIVANTPNWMTNNSILENDHIELILSLLQKGAQNTNVILFDEYIHGQGNGSKITTLYPKGLLVFILQAIIFTIMGLWYQGKRFGPIFIPREETVRYSDEGIKALSSWYLRGHRHKESLHIQADYLKIVLQEMWGIPYSKNWEDVAVPLERKWKQRSTDEIRSFLSDLTAVLQKEKVSKQEYLLWSKNIDRLRKEVEKG